MRLQVHGPRILRCWSACPGFLGS